MSQPAGSRSRCLVVGAAATLGAAAASSPLLPDLVRSVHGPDQAIVRLCLVALLGGIAWAWTATCAAVVEAWPGRAVPAGPEPRGVVRRLVLTACGVALTGAMVAPSAPAASPGPHPDALAGLPLPERAEGPAHAPQRRHVLVRAGDSLWSLAAADLPRRASAPAVTERWHRIYQLNREAIGPDPDLIHPGQRLRLPR